MIWGLHITRKRVEQRGGTVRTVGTYEVYHNGQAVYANLHGEAIETHGPGDNTRSGVVNHRRLAAGTYPLWTHGSDRYATYGYADNQDYWDRPHPCLGIEHTGVRAGCLVHPGIGFLASIGCVNLSEALPGPDDDIDYPDSWYRVVAVIEDAKKFLGPTFPGRNNVLIPHATLVITGEP